MPEIDLAEDTKQSLPFVPRRAGKGSFGSGAFGHPALPCSSLLIDANGRPLLTRPVVSPIKRTSVSAGSTSFDHEHFIFQQEFLDDINCGCPTATYRQTDFCTVNCREDQSIGKDVV